MKAAYPPFFLEVSRSDQQAWVQHFRDCGFEVTHSTYYRHRSKLWQGEGYTSPDHPLYAGKLIAKSERDEQTGRRRHLIILKLPDTDQAFKQRHPTLTHKTKRTRKCPKR